ncbi:hypothetical protein [Spirosoma utsteinense]|uniref:Uncharacterized protein n=1 Tax=Spirosoma utsteinense TaxID=2585773 RepID=A0ABR6W7S9_9BACT|nr:hypothetical protein [Spirosoma utsteinense]MBC3789035.1 hypothetical protein [Spirosoma utsteinense]MBC3792639.1 hypothetical protein [Spirosoma utsteinense]
MSITQAHFRQLPRMLQEGALQLWGVYITALEIEGGYQTLYNLGAFYVEVFREEGRNGLRMACFNNPDKLLPYLRLPLVAKDVSPGVGVQRIDATSPMDSCI